MGNLCGGGKTVTGKNDKLDEEVKLLLLGSGESGKSTFKKQIKILYCKGYSEEELFHYKSSIYANILITVKNLTTCCKDKGLKFKNSENEERAKQILTIADSDTSLLLNATEKYTAKVANNIIALWDDPSMKEAFKHRYDYHVFDGAEYFFNHLERLKPPTYKPTNEDILRCRRKTTGIIETKFNFGDKKFNLVDVGGQRNERKKWIHCFDGVACVLFVSSLGDYDQKCYEDDITNRMQESMDLFDETVNGNTFRSTRIMLFLNKCDVFKKKLEKKPLKDFFQNYKGGTDFSEAKKFVDQQFRKINKFDPDRIYTHYTQATDSDSVKGVFTKIKGILEGNIKSTDPM